MAHDDEKSLDDLTVAELRERASDLEITGRSSMNKSELVEAIGDAEPQVARINGENGSSSAEAEDSDAHSEGSEDSDAEDRPWRDSSSSSGGDGEEDASDITAPSIGPNTTIEHIPPEERLDEDKISDVDAMGLDKRRQVQGKRYGASPAKQLAVYGGALAVIAALVFGGIVATNELDKAPPEGEVPDAPWADVEQKPPPPIDFPPSIIK
ncbi:MAG TPA: Rho termination factor N-terminal domain-containing protein [Solirubrobacterales bacterium]|nr:Rho termination factor N-terminal domain-containing protein [Solirubrobacterales bacterium]